MLLALLLFYSASEVRSEVLELEYEGFKIWIDCDRRGAIKFNYVAKSDNGTYGRRDNFYLDPDVPTRCQQTSAASYKRPRGEIQYDRGHLVPANHVDGSEKAIFQSNFMTNILPQAAGMNRGAWLLTEEIIECYRDIEPLTVWGGVIWGTDDQDDFFLLSHGVRTPDAFWKVVIGDRKQLAWIIPNSAEAGRKRLDSYLVNIRKIEEISGMHFDVSETNKDEVAATSWALPKGCDKS